MLISSSNTSVVHGPAVRLQRFKMLAAFCVPLLALTACSTESSADSALDSPSESSAEVPELSDEELIQEDLDSFWEMTLSGTSGLTDADRPEVDTIRLISPEEYGEVMVSCLSEAGHTDVTLTEDGEGFETATSSEAEQEALNLAIYTCHAQYPTDPKYSRPFTEEQWQLLYDYVSGELRDCLVDAGHTVSEPPSFDVYVETYYNEDAWSPYSEIGVNASEFAALQERCPQHPDGLYE